MSVEYMRSDSVEGRNAWVYECETLRAPGVARIVNTDADKFVLFLRPRYALI